MPLITFFYVYIIQSLTHVGEIYIGFTTNLRKRLEQHNEGENVSTRRYKPWKLIYFEAFSSEKLAKARELSLKHNGNPMRELKKRIGLLPKKSDKGFTLFEVLIVVGILGVVALFTVGIDTRSISRSTASAESTVLLQMLIHARSRAMNNEFQMPHGVYVDTNNFVLFRGSSYAGAVATELTPRSTQVSATGDSEFVFTQLSGTTTAGNIILASGVDSVDIDINEAGAIAW